MHRVTIPPAHHQDTVVVQQLHLCQHLRLSTPSPIQLHHQKTKVALYQHSRFQRLHNLLFKMAHQEMEMVLFQRQRYQRLPQSNPVFKLQMTVRPPSRLPGEHLWLPCAPLLRMNRLRTVAETHQPCHSQLFLLKSLPQKIVAALSPHFR